MFLAVFPHLTYCILLRNLSLQPQVTKATENTTITTIIALFLHKDVFILTLMKNTEENHCLTEQLFLDLTNSTNVQVSLVMSYNVS